MEDSTKAEPAAKVSKKRAAPDDVEPAQGDLPSPSLSATGTTPKRPRLKATLAKDTPSHLDITKTLTKAPLTPKTPSEKPTRKQQLATDPINVNIYALRKEGRAWDDVATRTNEICRLGADHELTPAACYSRFFRNGPLVAKEKGEEWKRELYTNMKGPIAAADGDDLEDVEGVEDDDEAKAMEKTVVAAAEKVKAEFWKHVAEAVSEGLEDGKVMSEAEVKAAYDRAGKDGD